MGNPYFLDVKAILDKLANDQKLMLEEKIILLRLVEGYIAKVVKELEDKLAQDEGGLDA